MLLYYNTSTSFSNPTVILLTLVKVLLLYSQHTTEVISLLFDCLKVKREQQFKLNGQVRYAPFAFDVLIFGGRQVFHVALILTSMNVLQTRVIAYQQALTQPFWGLQFRNRTIFHLIFPSGVMSTDAHHFITYPMSKVRMVLHR